MRTFRGGKEERSRIALFLGAGLKWSKFRKRDAAKTSFGKGEKEMIRKSRKKE